jgi:phosphate transport system substrate-binding protein
MRRFRQLCRALGWVALSAAACSMASCRPQAGNERSPAPRRTVIQTRGSDSMVPVALLWAEEYRKVAPQVEVEVSGGGSATGFTALIQGTVDIAHASGPMRPEEIEAAIERHPGKKPQEYVVGFDALAIYVHKDNPLAEISLDQLRHIFGEKGDVTRWSQLGVRLSGARSDDIILVSRQSNSGTYEFFRGHVLSNEDFKLGARELNGSKDVVALVGATPTAIGYGGMGYATEAVKALAVRAKADAVAYPPTRENATNHRYPLARPLLLFTLGTPEGAVRNYIEWILSEAGQRVVAERGYVPFHSPPPARR